MNVSQPDSSSLRARLQQKYSNNNNPNPNSQPFQNPKNADEPIHLSRLLDRFSIQDKTDSNARINPPENKNDEPRNQEQNLAKNVMEAIARNQINPISLLNEVASKVQKRVDFQIKDSVASNEKQLQFESICSYNMKKIGFGKGGSKQTAKAESAKEGVQALISQQEFKAERTHIYLYLQTTVQNNSNGSLPANENNLSKNKYPGVGEPYMNGSALYELNQVAGETGVEVKWELSPAAGSNGGFTVQVTFGNLFAVGEGRNKADAKKEAAEKIVMQLRKNRELKQNYNFVEDKVNLNFQKEKEPIFMHEEPVVSEDVQAAQKKDQNIHKGSGQVFEEYLRTLEDKYIIPDEKLVILLDFFQQISDHTDLISLNPKKDVNESLLGCSLVPIGSFALECMRSDHLAIDALLLIKNKDYISELDLIRDYQKSLVNCQKLGSNQGIHLNYGMSFNISQNNGFCLIVTTNSAIGPLEVSIRLAKEPEYQVNDQETAAKRYRNSYMHVKRIRTDEKVSDVNLLKRLMKLVRIFRKNASLNAVPPEIFDIALVESFAGSDVDIEPQLINSLMLFDAPDAFAVILQKYGRNYENMYNDIPTDVKSVLSSKCMKSSEAILNKVFAQSHFY